MPATIAELATAMGDAIEAVVPLTFVGLIAAFAGVVGLGAWAVKRYAKSFR